MLVNNLAVMDETAITLCKENSIHVVVFNLTKSGNILRWVGGRLGGWVGGWGGGVGWGGCQTHCAGVSRPGPLWGGAPGPLGGAVVPCRVDGCVCGPPAPLP